MPETMSVERRKLLSFYRAEIVLTPAHKGMKGAIKKAIELKNTLKNSIILQQVENSPNVLSHYETTEKEIWENTEGKVDILVAGIGTGGTITGISKVIKSLKEIYTVDVEPESSPLISKGNIGAHKILGIGAGFIPKILNLNLVDEIVTVSDKEAYLMTKRLAKEEGILFGISSDTTLSAAIKIANKQENKNKTIVVISPDLGERYLSILDIFEEEEDT
jgi:cysteine synthase A